MVLEQSPGGPGQRQQTVALTAVSAIMAKSSEKVFISLSPFLLRFLDQL